MENHVFLHHRQFIFKSRETVDHEALNIAFRLRIHITHIFWDCNSSHQRAIKREIYKSIERPSKRIKDFVACISENITDTVNVAYQGCKVGVGSG